MNQKPLRNIHLISPGYRPEKNPQYKLVVRIQNGGYAFVVGNPETREVLFLSSYIHVGLSLGDVIRILREDFTASFQDNVAFQHTTVMYANRKVTLVPDALFIPEKRIRYLSSCVELDADDQLHSFPLEELSAHCVFALEGYLQQELNQIITAPEYLHPAFLIITLPQNPHRSAFDTELRALVLNTHLYLAAFRNNQMRFFNHYHFDNHQEMLYYILGARKIIEENNTGKTFITYAGDIEQKSEKLQMLSPYFIQPDFAQIPDNTHCHPVFNKIEWHVYADL